jgi:hypothetical protein
MTEEFSYSPHTFPFHSDCYIWPQVAVITEDMESVILNVHCLCDVNRREFTLIGFIGMDREEQISQTIYLAKEIGAEVIAFKGVGFNDQIIGSLMAHMTEPLPEECPGQKVGFVTPGWPNKIQRRVLRKLLNAATPGESFHEERLAKRLHMPVEEVRHHLQVLADLGLVEES